MTEEMDVPPDPISLAFMQMLVTKIFSYGEIDPPQEDNTLKQYWETSKSWMEKLTGKKETNYGE